MYTPSGLKNKTVNLHTTTTKVKIDHTIRPLLTHTVPPEPPQPNAHFLRGGEGLIHPPLPCLDCKYIPVVEPLLYDRRNKDVCTAKEKQI